MSNDKTTVQKLPFTNATWDGDKIIYGYNAQGDNLYWDGEGFRGQLGGQLIDGFLAPVHIFTEARTLHDAVFQAEPGAVFHCGNHALVAQGQHLAGVWDKSGIEFKLVPEAWRIAEPETYADIRKD